MSSRSATGSTHLDGVSRYGATRCVHRVPDSRGTDGPLPETWRPPSPPGANSHKSGSRPAVLPTGAESSLPVLPGRREAEPPCGSLDHRRCAKPGVTRPRPITLPAQHARLAVTAFSGATGRWYLERSRRLYGDQPCGEGPRGRHPPFDVALRLLHPLMPFLTNPSAPPSRRPSRVPFDRAGPPDGARPTRTRCAGCRVRDLVGAIAPSARSMLSAGTVRARVATQAPT